MNKMKSYIYKLSIAAIGLVTAVSCTEIRFGDDFLGDAPESSGATMETMFSREYYAEQVLVKAYSGMPYGLPYKNNGSNVFRFGLTPIEVLTDLCHNFIANNASDLSRSHYYEGLLSANNVQPNLDMYYFSNTDWAAIKYALIYIENVDRVPDMTDQQKRLKKAEAKMVLAICYFNMLHHIGGFPWLEHSIDVNDDMHFPRCTFAESVEHLVNLLDEVIAETDFTWKWDDSNDGRMSRAGAMALKFKVLQFAASPMFNSDTKWHPQADEYTCYGNYDRQRWVAAQEAGKAFFDEIGRRGEYSLIQPKAQTHEARRAAYQQAYYDRGGSEIIISLRKGNYVTDTYGGDGQMFLNVNQRTKMAPTLNYVNMFPWEDGTDFPEDFDWEKPSRDPFFADDSTVPTRDPRLYETVAIPGDVYFDGRDVPTYRPNTTDTGSGFLVMKFVLRNTADRSNRPVQWPHTRLAEIMLGYAEVINEVNGGPTAEAYKMVNDVRARVGLKGIANNMNQVAFREAVLKERALELGFEEVRWFDLIRWNRSDDFCKDLWGLDIVGNATVGATVFKYSPIKLPPRTWASNWNTKWYLSPIPQTEINKNYGMTQNPGW